MPAAGRPGLGRPFPQSFIGKEIARINSHQVLSSLDVLHRAQQPFAIGRGSEKVSGLQLSEVLQGNRFFFRITHCRIMIALTEAKNSGRTERPEESYPFMRTETKEPSRILEAVHETAGDLQAAGFMSERRMKDYDTLCLGPLPGRSLVLERLKAERSIVPARLDLIELGLPPEHPCEMTISEALTEQREEG